MKPCILICDTCGFTVPSNCAAEAQKLAMLPERDGRNLMLRRRSAALSRAELQADGATECPKCGSVVEAVVMGGGGPGTPV